MSVLESTMTTDQFAEKMLGHLIGGAVSLMTSVGHRTGLFDTMSGMEPATPAEIADRAGLQERYVREWLGVMTTSGIVLHDAATGRFHLPPEHAAVLTRASVPTNMAATMQWISVLGGVEDEIVRRFREGGGVPYCCYHRFNDVMAEESDQTTVWGLIDHILPLVPGLVGRLEKGLDVLDIGCGRGHAIMRLAEAFPESRCVGYDFLEDAIDAARREAEERGIFNVRFDARDAARLEEPGRYDLITAFDIVHDQRDPAEVLRQIRKALRPDGVFLMQDIGGSSHVEKNVGRPLAPFVYTISCMHCMSVSLSQGGAGLGAAWGEELAEQMLRDAGFTSIEKHTLEHDMMNVYYVATP